MLLQNEDVQGTFSSMFWLLKIRCTTRCNMACKHCYAAAEDYPYEPAELTNFEWAERLIRSPHIKYVILQGGEPTLAFDAMKNCSDIAKRYKKSVIVYTNGKLLFEDLDFRERFTKEVCPDTLIVSYNKYLEEQTDQAEVVNTLAEYYKDHPTIGFGSTAIIDNSNMKAMRRFTEATTWPPYDPSYFPEIESKMKLKFWKFQLPLCNASRARRSGVAAKDCARVRWPNGIGCDFSTVLMPSGFLQADCGCGDIRKTLLGFIDDFGDDPIEYLAQHQRRHFTNAQDIEINDYFEICERYKSIRCLDRYPLRTLPDEEYEKRMRVMNEL